ncbi:MAG: aminopeptidase [Spirochaetes bacterium]|nr:aminopeptidase [Spirochaetota bacterium]
MQKLEASKILSFFPSAAAAVLLLLFAFVGSGCYTIRQGSAFLGYMNRAVPLEEIDDADFIALVHDIRRFAGEELGLDMDRNFTRYVQLDRDFIAAVVSASAKDSFTRHYWRFPIVGSMPYKGFFDVEGARRERERLEARGLDVWVRGVGAFSTLGWFRDPFYSFMRNWEPYRLADMIIHEQLHATVWIRGQAQFNEGLAQFVGEEGARLFIEHRFGRYSQEYQDKLDSKANSRAFVAFMRELVAELDELFSRGLDRETVLAERQKIFDAAKERFDAEYDERFTNDNFRGFSQMTINNAYLDLFRLYHGGGNFFEDLFERSGRDLPAFIAASRTLTRRGGDLRGQLERALGL